MSPTIAKARQLGFSTEICMLILDDCLFRKNTGAAIIDATIGDAKKKLAKIKFAYDRFPPVIRRTIRLPTDNTEELKFSNGSQISVGTGYRGDTLQILLVSEYGKISVDRLDVAKEIKNGALMTKSSAASLRAGGINVWAARRTILGGPPASSAARSLLPASSALDRQRPHPYVQTRWLDG
jgi:hypothetical protein